MNCINCGRDFWHCKCERFKIPPVKQAAIHKYKVVKGIHQIREKDRKYKIIFEDGQFKAVPIICKCLHKKEEHTPMCNHVRNDFSAMCACRGFEP